MFSRVLVASLLSGLFLPVAFCQKPQIIELSQIPDYVLYESFFFRVKWLDDSADKLRADGKDDAGFRTKLRREANLTESEDLDLKAIAKDALEKTAAIAKEARAAYPGGARSATSTQQRELRDRRQQVINDHIKQLESALGPARFTRLDAYVRRTSTVKMVEVKPPAQ